MAVGVFSHDVSAIIQNGTATASEGLDVSALSRRVESSVVTKAGHIPATSTFGLGGAVAVHIASVRNEARLKSAARYALEGAVNVEAAIAHGMFETIGDASGKRVRKALALGPVDIPLIDTPTYRADSVGVGAGIAVGVIGVDVSAVIEDGVRFSNKKELDSLRVAASFAGTEELRAAAGASGGISATPVAATDISGIMVEAYLGKSDEAAKVLGDVSVTARGSIERTLTADAEAAGARVGAGAALAVSVFNDSATADVQRDLDAGGDVLVNADSVSRLEENVKASTNGALPAATTTGGGSSSEPSSTTQERDDALSGKTEPSGTTVDPDVKDQADKQADEALARGGKLAGDVNTKNVNTQNVSDASASRQRAQTSEGSIQVAAAMAVNIQKNLSRAKVFDGNDVLALGDITVLARNDTDAVVAANASATDSLYGVGVAVAVNTVAHENIAYLGTGRVSGASLTVAAEIYEKEDAQALEKAYEDLVSFLARNGAMGDLIDLIRKSDYESSAAHQLDELLKKSNWTEEERARIAGYVDELTDRALWKEEDAATLRERVDDLILSTWEAGRTDLTRDHAYAMENYVREALRAHYAQEAAPDNSLYGDLCAPLIAELIAGIDAYRAEQAHRQRMVDLACDLAEGKTLSGEDQAALNEYLGMEADAENMQAIREMIVDEAIARMTGEESALSSASVYPAALGTLLNDQFAALANPQAWREILYAYVTGGSWNPDPTLVMGVERTYTALIELLGARFGSGGELDGVGHRISTQAISGVGASSVGVAGAVAITVADARSEATVAAQNNAIDLTGDAAIRADEAQKVYTTASGSADKVLGNIAKMRTVNNPGTSVGVGASFALNLLTADVRATLGAGRDLTAASLDVFARLRNDVDTISVAGSDPIARRDKAMQAVPTLGNAGNAAALKAQAEAANAGTNTKGISADASVALAIVESNVQALVDAGATVKTTNEEDTIETLREGAEGTKRANVAVQAMQSGDSYAEGKAFSAGSRAAVGATVAVSLMSSDVLAALRADTTAAGSVRVYALTKNTDEVNAVATSIGASIDRVLEKFRLGLNYVSPGAGPSNLSAKIATALSEKGTPLVGKSTANLKKASESIPLSNNILRVFNVDLDAATQRATAPASSASAAANAESGGAAKPQDVAMNSGTLNIAAAIGVAYNNHAALAEITGKVVSGGDVEAHAENRANFRTRASGATATSASIANVVGTAAAITVNRNRAEAEVAGSVEAAGNLDVSARHHPERRRQLHRLPGRAGRRPDGRRQPRRHAQHRRRGRRTLRAGAGRGPHRGKRRHRGPKRRRHRARSEQARRARPWRQRWRRPDRGVRRLLRHPLRRQHRSGAGGRRRDHHGGLHEGRRPPRTHRRKPVPVPLRRFRPLHRRRDRGQGQGPVQPHHRQRHLQRHRPQVRNHHQHGQHTRRAGYAQLPRHGRLLRRSRLRHGAGRRIQPGGACRHGGAAADGERCARGRGQKRRAHPRRERGC